MPDAVLPNPYIGPTAFTEQDSERFFGRAEETRELASLVIARRAVLLYAQSGSGKTSLLQASLIPELKRRKRVETFPIARVMGSAETSGNIYTENALVNLFRDASESATRKTFSDAFGAVLDNDPKARRQPCLLVFDQFEEIFTFHPELTAQRRAFFESLGDCLAAYPQLSLLLSMREEYLAELDAYAALLPDRLRTRMRLERLGVDNALDAIRGPAVLAGLPFAPGAAEELVDNLRRIRTGAADKNGLALGQYVEPVQLQIVCRQLWSRLTEDASRGKREIDAEDIREYANVDGALIQFYRDSLAKAQAVGVTERTLRRWFGDRLITPAGTRGLVYRGNHETDGLPNAAVDILRDCYIVRSDLRGGDVWYELAHDRLVEPVQQDNLAWKVSYRNPIAEALEQGPNNLLTGKALTAALQYAKDNSQELTSEERAFLNKSGEEQKKARRIKALSGGAVAAAALLLIYVFWEVQRGKVQEAKAAAEAALAKQRVTEAQHFGETALRETFQSANRLNFHTTPNSKELFYVGTDQHIHELWGWSNKTNKFDGWHETDLTNANTPTPRPKGEAGSSLAGFYDDVAKTDKVFYIGPDQHIYEIAMLYYSNSQWTGADLTQLSSGPPAIGSALTAHANPTDRSEEVFFVTGAPGRQTVQVLSTSTSAPTWKTSNLFSESIGAHPAYVDKDSPLVAVIDLTTSPPRNEVLYRGIDGRIHELWSIKPGRWSAAER